MGNDALNVLKKALKLEQDGRAFYLQAAERTVDLKGKSMFASLADDEVKHAEMIERQIAALAEGKDWLPIDLVAQGVDLESPLFPQGKEAFEKAVAADSNELEALAFALQIENDSYELYAKMAKMADDLNARQMYGYLAAAERTHFNLLMSNYESLSTIGGWI
ncbi:MAG: ferritin family protein [Anaerolineae bacterium]|nr:ferritin family protein [Anaerolineae bacterium]